MKLPNYVKSYSWIMHDKNAKGFTSFITRKIYLREEIFEDLKKANPNHQNIAILMHEEVHFNNSKDVNLIKYLLKFLVSRKFRLNGELEAYKEQFKYLKNHNLNYDLDYLAKAMSSKRFLRVGSYEELKTIMNKTWKDA